MSMRTWLVMVGVITTCGLVAIAVLLLAPKPPVPGEIKRQFTATLLIPRGPGIVVDRESMKYDAKLKLLTFNVQAFGKSVIFSEQPTPESFTDIPQVYERLTQTMREYSQFDTDVGRVHLTRPEELKGLQAAALNTKGTLLFAKPERDLADEEWRRLFKSLEVVR